MPKKRRRKLSEQSTEVDNFVTEVARVKKKQKRVQQSDRPPEPATVESTSGFDELRVEHEILPMKKRKKKIRKQPAASVVCSDLISTTTQQTCASSMLPGSSAQRTDEVQAIIDSLMIEGSGTLSDRLNPGHPKFDKALKAKWKGLSKKARAAIVDADQKKLKQVKDVSASNLLSHPFPTEADDHCETSPQAYTDIAGLLDLVAKRLGKTRASLAIYDPYYCAGTMRRHLRDLGFEHVHNECVDFYEIIRTKQIPPHDVLLTNPPYSQDHVEKLLKFCGTNNKPYLLLMPNYVCSKPYFRRCLVGAEESSALRTNAPIFYCPKKRYCYWTPRGLRGKDKVQGHMSELGHRTSPFISFWYVDLEPTVSRKALLKHVAKADGGCYACEDVAALPAVVRPG